MSVLSRRLRQPIPVFRLEQANMEDRKKHRPPKSETINMKIAEDERVWRACGK